MRAIDPRLKPRPWPKLIGALACGAGSTICAYQIWIGASSGVVLRFRRRSWQTRSISLDGDASGYWFHMVGWGLGALFLAACAYLLFSFLADDGGVLGTAEQRILRRVARLRAGIDHAIFLGLASAAPRPWRSAQLVLVRQPWLGGSRLCESVLDPGGQPCAAIALSPHVLERIDDLRELYDKHGVPLERALYTITRASGRLRTSATFEWSPDTLTGKHGAWPRSC